MTTTIQASPNSPAVPSRRRWVQIALAIPLTLVVLALLIVGGIFMIAATNFRPVSSAPVEVQTTQFDGRYLITVSDADMVGTAYGDGLLMQVPGEVDTLSLIELPVNDANARVIEIPVSNSVTSWPQITAVSPDGNLIYVVETAGQVDDDVVQRAPDDFPPGQLVTAIDLSTGANTARTITVDTGHRAIHLAISADGAYLAIGTRGPGRLVVIPTNSFTDDETFTTYDVPNGDGQPAYEITAVSWHPSGRYLAVGVDGRDLQFYQVETEADGRVGLEPFGERVALGNRITYGQFTRDGRFYLTAELNWSVFPGVLGSVLNPPGEMIAVRFDDSAAANHREVSRVEVGQSPEGFAVSVQEDLIITVNMNRTYLPDGLTWLPGSTLNSLSLLTFDRETGNIVAQGQPYGFEGVLPEHAMFDSDGGALGVVIYNQRENPMSPGYVEFWNVLRDVNVPHLERTSVRIPVVRGSHAMNFIP